jgi:hypothetical protein
MTTISKLALIAAIAVAGIASPALAQSFDPDNGTGNVVSFGYGPMGAPNDTVAVRQTNHGKIARRQNGLRAFARVPGGAAGGDSNDPALTGGGSIGYNQLLEQF